MKSLTRIFVSPEEFRATVASLVAVEHCPSLSLALRRGSEDDSAKFYLRGPEAGNYRAIRQLPKPEVQAASTVEQQSNRWQLKTVLSNSAAWPAAMVRRKVVREKTGDRILRSSIPI